MCKVRFGTANVFNENSVKLKTVHVCYLCLKCGINIRNAADDAINEKNFQTHAREKDHERNTSKQLTLDKIVNKTRSVTTPSMPVDLLILLSKFVSSSRISFMQGTADPLYQLV